MSKLDFVKILLDQANPDVLILSETWLSTRISEGDIAFDGYYVIRTDRISKGGGVAMYIKHHISVHMLSSITVPK